MAFGSEVALGSGVAFGSAVGVGVALGSTVGLGVAFGSAVDVPAFVLPTEPNKSIPIRGSRSFTPKKSPPSMPMHSIASSAVFIYGGNSIVTMRSSIFFADFDALECDLDAWLCRTVLR